MDRKSGAALLGAAGGLGLAMLILDALQGFLPEWMIPMGGFTLDVHVLTFTLGTSLVTSLLFGALPLWERTTWICAPH